MPGLARGVGAWGAEARWAHGDAGVAIDLLTEALKMDREDVGLRLTLVDHRFEVQRVAEGWLVLGPLWRWFPDDPEIQRRANALGMARR